MEYGNYAFNIENNQDYFERISYIHFYGKLKKQNIVMNQNVILY